jgi:hypothetical protein
LLGQRTNGQELIHLLLSWNTPQIILPVQATFKLIWPDRIRPKNVIFYYLNCDAFAVKVEVEVRFTPTRGHEGPEE